MAKTAKVKKRQVTVHSRAARRAASPTTTPKPAHTTRDSHSPSRPSTINPHALAAKDAGIQKRQKKTSTMTRAQRLRHQKGLERAEENMDKLANKRLKSLGKGKKVTERAKGWEDVNGDGVVGKKGKKERVVDGEEGEGDGEVKKEREWGGDEDMDEAVEVNGEAKVVDAAVTQSVVAPVEVDEML
ncbi:ribosome biogenesis protein alb1 [Stemphylium lycopersici]|uniref:Ribosome biogenesis protein alb1 n=1 Tax=Stemphylium lycopersici TaxID=183478 RepID=A0A364MS78_STELY|nr:ribosome biogenesis protein alb1 [Stemphylium lycopersici]RAR01374.1 ribosome biogenesis protein alb1 [Stemphylium lycopersici]RAR01581.1 ribosome biogenesis protein alb1 [Stemphylium lycopersici]